MIQVKGVTVSLLGELFDRLPMGVVVLDEHGRILVYNRAEERLAHRAREKVMHREFFREVAPCMNVRELGGIFRDQIGRTDIDVRTEFSFPFPFLEQPRDVVVTMKSILVEERPFGCLFIEDVSLQRSIDRMKQTLTDLLIHDLKNPLTAVLFSLDAVSARLDGREDLRELLQEGRDAAGRLQQMLVNLLDVTRLETNVFPLRRQSVALAALMGDVAAENHPLARGRRAALVFEEVDPDAVAEVDPSLVRRAVSNLVENGLRYARKRVTVSAARGEGGTVIEVRDDGSGIPPELRHTLFERVPVAITGLSGQTEFNRGLGLTFVRLAARAHGGDVSVECPTPGGTIFRMTFPDRGTVVDE